MIFRTYSDSIENRARKISIKNWMISTYHWGSEKSIVSYLDSCELLFPLSEKQSDFVSQTVKIWNSFPRVVDTKIFRDKDNKESVLVVNYTDIQNYNNLEPFEREASIELKGTKFQLKIVELDSNSCKLIKNNELSIPENWIEDVDFTKRFMKYKRAFGNF